MTSSCFANSVKNRSAGGQDEHPWLVYNSTRTGPANTGSEDNAQMQDVQTNPNKRLMANRPINDSRLVMQFTIRRSSHV